MDSMISLEWVSQTKTELARVNTRIDEANARMAEEKAKVVAGEKAREALTKILAEFGATGDAPEDGALTQAPSEVPSNPLLGIHNYQGIPVNFKQTINNEERIIRVCQAVSATGRDTNLTELTKWFIEQGFTEQAKKSFRPKVCRTFSENPNIVRTSPGNYRWSDKQSDELTLL